MKAAWREGVRHHQRKPEEEGMARHIIVNIAHQ